MNPAICIGMQEMDDVRAGWRPLPAPKSAKLSVAKAHLCCEFERTHGTRTPYAGRYDRQSLAAFAMPAGAHELRLKTIVTGDQPIRLRVAIEPSERSKTDPFVATEAIVPAAGSDGTVTIPWTSDGLDRLGDRLKRAPMAVALGCSSQPIKARRVRSASRPGAYGRARARAAS
jgi:hypothetical protein